MCNAYYILCYIYIMGATYQQILGLSIKNQPNFVANYSVIPLNSVCHHTEVWGPPTGKY
jgi:hypothetical protein